MTTEIAEYSKTEAALADLGSRYKDVVFPVATKEGMAAAIKGRAEIRGYYVALEKTRVEIKAPALRRTQLIDSEARQIDKALHALYDPIDAQIKQEEKRKEDERLAVARAHQEKIDAEAKAMKDVEEARMAAERAEIARQQAVLQEQIRLQIVADAAARLKIETEQREAREKIEAEERASRLAREEADRVARQAREADEAAAKAAREAEEARIKAANDALEAKRREVEEQQRQERERQEAAAKAERDRKEAAERAEREAEELREREVERAKNELLDARSMLTTFVGRFGHLAEFASVVKAIRSLK